VLTDDDQREVCEHDADRHDPEAGGCIECRCTSATGHDERRERWATAIGETDTTHFLSSPDRYRLAGAAMALADAEHSEKVRKIAATWQEKVDKANQWGTDKALENARLRAELNEER
jgi:hypothetical protein